MLFFLLARSPEAVSAIANLARDTPRVLNKTLSPDGPGNFNVSHDSKHALPQAKWYTHSYPKAMRLKSVNTAKLQKVGEELLEVSSSSRRIDHYSHGKLLECVYLVLGSFRPACGQDDKRCGDKRLQRIQFGCSCWWYYRRDHPTPLPAGSRT